MGFEEVVRDSRKAMPPKETDPRAQYAFFIDKAEGERFDAVCEELLLVKAKVMRGLVREFTAKAEAVINAHNQQGRVDGPESTD